MSDDVVLTLSGLRYWRHWSRTLKQARRLACPSSRFVDRLSVRLHSLPGIKRPTFILGCPRSGTTYLGKLLAELPAVTYFYEPPVMKYYTRLIYQQRVSEASARRFYRWGCRSLMLAAPGNGPRLLEKNPKHTWVATTLYNTFPDAQFVIITRDGRDVCVSLSEKPWHQADSIRSRRREPGGYLYGPYPHFYIEPDRAEEYMRTCDLHRCIWIWRRYAEQIEQLKQDLPAASQFHLRYEDLVRDPQVIINELLGFLGENDAESMQAVLTSATVGHAGSVGRWQQALSAQQMAIVDQEAGHMLRKLGYE
jgi:hypothetical protein